MRNRAGLLILVALAAGGLAAILAFKFLRSPEAPAVAKGAQVSTPVVVAARDLDVGTTLEPADVQVLDWPGGATPAGYAAAPDEVVGRGVVQPIHANEPVLPFKLAAADLGRGLAMLVPEGMRAVSVPVDDVVAVAGWVRPGTRVDVLVTLDRLPNQSEPMTQIVLQNVEVLGNDRVIAQDEEGEAVDISVVTLLVDPESAEKLSLAQGKGDIQLALRNNLDLATVETPGIRASQLVRFAAPPAPVRASGPPPPTRPRGFTIDVYRGPERSEVNMGGQGG
ncbi:MAG: Flp pilus assembly protein CpaB [Thermoanaerobaculia bacterium]